MSYRLAIDDGRFVQTLEVRSERLSVGTSPSCRLRLGSEGVGLRHAAIRQQGDRVVVEDLSHAPGITVDGRPVASATVGPGSVIGIGRATLRVLDVTPDRAAAPRGAAAARRAPAVTASPESSRRARPRRRLGPATISVALHLALFALFRFHVLFDGPPPSVDAAISLDVQRQVEMVEAFEEPRLETPREWTEPVEPAPPDAAPVEFPEDLFAPPPADRAPELAPLPPNDRVELPSREGATPIGVGPAPDVARTSFGKESAGDANARVSGLVADDPGAGRVLAGVRERAGEDRVWVVRGDYDQAERVLDALGIVHRAVPHAALEDADLPDTLRVLVVNCSGRPVSDAAAARIGAWVAGGGSLLSTDWGLDRVVTRACPGRLRILHAGVRTALTADATVGAAATGSHPFLAGVPADGPFRWWLEDSSVPFREEEGAGVDVLVRSEDLGRRNGADPVAATFRHEQGTVLHLLGHVFQQEGTLRGAYAMQRLVLNFLDAALRE